MFIAKLHQPGGCDYTIGCGVAVRTLPENIETMEQAERYVAEEWGEYVDPDSEDPLDGITIYEVIAVKEVDIDSLAEAVAAARREEEAAEEEARELAELKRLQEKHKGKV